MKQARINQLLPQVFQRVMSAGTPLASILDLMEEFHTAPEAILGNLDAIFDPRRTPDRFVPYLAGWVDLGMLLEIPHAGASAATVSLSTGLGRLRELTANAAVLSEWRGTGKGLQLFLQTATGSDGFSIDEHVAGTDGKTRPFHIRVLVPGELVVHRALIERIIELEKPAYVTYELEFKLTAPQGSQETSPEGSIEGGKA